MLVVNFAEEERARAPMDDPHQPGQVVRFQLLKPVTAVQLREQPGSSIRNPTAALVEIPPGVVVELEGVPAVSGLCNILWNGEAYSVFYEDLRETGQILHEAL